MSELEKFKRRMIRMVARLHVQQKKPEEELWNYLRQQTKCDCKWLWERMRALTLKRLKRLLIAEDRQENIPAVARMSLTDWLLFDCILVHEKIDVIGLELLAEGRTAEPRQMFELFSLVQKFELEGLRGEQLARAWTAATVSYNSGGRQCSPMLLQRRWYQLKEVTREKFYNFWFSYRGNAKLLIEALKDKPTRLQTAVAKRYPHIITMPFMEWEELIEKKLVIMPPEFEIQMKSRSGQLPKPVEDNDADLVLLEPEIETIDLGVDSESDDELRDEVEGSKATQMIAEDISTVQSIALKQEPIDEEDNIEDSINLDSTHLEAIDAEINHIEGIEALEKIDIPIQIDDTEKPKPPVKKKRGRKKKLPEPIEIEDDGNIDHSDAMEYIDTEEDTSCSIEGNVVSKENDSSRIDNITLPPSTDDVIESSKIDVSSSPTLTPRQIDIKTEMTMATKYESSKSIEDTIASNSETSVAVRISPVADITTELTEVSEANIRGEFDSNIDELPEMPQITNVFGNVNIPDEALQKLSSYLEKTKNKSPAIQDQDVEDEIEEDIIKTEVADSSYATKVDGSSEVQVATFKVDENDESEIKVSGENFPDNLLDDAIPHMTFDDDGIEFIDDGIVEEHEGEHAIKYDENAIKGVKIETSGEEKSPEESQSIDLKLLMVPVVYTRKLEQMNNLRNKPIFYVKGEDSIERILIESRPVSKKAIQIKKEPQPIDKSSSDNEEDVHDDLFDQPDDASTHSSDSEDSIPEEKKVPISSVLFKKPRNRDYGPLVICKNPDFNTRLKRLTAGFLSYSRNRFMLRECKPLTIDLCKAFENKLVNNTVYLKQTAVSKCVVKQEKSEAHDENRQTPPVAPQEKFAQASDAPTTVSVQSLVNSILEKALPPSAREPENDISKEIGNRVDDVVERNKVIVLPNIDNVRRINQKLLVAEVSPMRMEHTSHVPPVSLVSASMEKLNLPIREETPVIDKPAVEKPVVKRPGKETPSGTVICSGQVINNTIYNWRGHGKYKMPWRPESRSREARGFWNTKKPKFKQPKSSDAQLLTVDTLNKMLIIVHDKDPVATHEKVTYKKIVKDKQRHELQRKVNEIQKMLTEEDSRSDIDETKDKEKQTATKNITPDETKPTFKFDSSKPKRGRPIGRGSRSRKGQKIDCSDGYGSYCCWITFKKNHPRSMNGHPCDLRCVCCCRKGIESETDPAIKKVCESIESVIQQSRGIVENEKNNVKGHIVNSDDDNICSLDNSTPANIVTKTKTFGSNVVDVESNVIDITDNDNDFTEMNTAVQDNSQNSSTPNDDTESNYEIVDSNVLGLIDIEKNTSGMNEKINQVGNNSDGIEINVNNSEGHDTVAANVTIAGDQDQAPSTEDCVIIDSDEPKILEEQNLPFVKVNVSYYQEPPPKRKRGRPVKLPEPIPKAPQIKKIYRRFNLCPITRKENETDNNVLFLNSNHIRKSNHPIFLGKNKILLTDVPLPRNKDKPVQVDPSPSVVNTSLPLPQGVNLMLLPNGVLTCTVDSNVQLTTEEITNLGVIIESIQKQISSAVSGVTDPATQLGSSLQVPAMLIDSPSQQLAPAMPIMTVPDITQNSDVVNILHDENDAQKPIDDNSQATTSPAENAESIANIAATENVTTIDNVISATSESAPEKNDDNSTKSDEIIQSTPVETDKASTPHTSREQPTVSEPTDPVLAVDTTNVNSTIESDKDKQNTSEEMNVNAMQDSKEVNRAETEPVNKKTILSDLMEMSGIFEEDIAPIESSPQLPEVPQHHIASEYPIVSPSSLPPTVANPANALTELTPITSFLELKYACVHNGNFFKLDLETKSLTPINVCIKKKEATNTERQPKQFVDLTDDADEGESNQNVVAKQNDNLNKYVIRKKTLDKSLSEPSFLKTAEPVKPLKLFKVVQPFSTNVNILQKGKRALNPNEDIVSLSEIASRAKRSRKQNLVEQVFEMPTFNFLTNEEEKEDYEFDGSFEDTVAPAEDSDSSDDEPLAKKVRRKEEASREAALARGPLPVRNNEPIESAAIPVPENVQDGLPPQNDDNELPLPEEQLDMPPAELEGSVEEPELPVEEMEEGALGPSEVEFLSDHDNEEEDCILGF